MVHFKIVEPTKTFKRNSHKITVIVDMLTHSLINEVSAVLDLVQKKFKVPKWNTKYKRRTGTFKTSVLGLCVSPVCDDAIQNFSGKQHLSLVL